MTTWYVPAADGCTRGQTYLTIHQMLATGTVTQRLGANVAGEPVTSPLVLGGRIYIFGSSGAVEISNLVPDSITPAPPPPPNTGNGVFSRFSWTEVF
jgi:hypothetical protein